jgi:CRISPR-associated exonuclease Cas4
MEQVISEQVIVIIENFLFACGAGFLLLALACFVLLFNEHRSQERRLVEEHKRALNLPAGDLVYENSDQLGEALTSDEYPLIGKPTYVVNLPDQRLVPIEVKPIAQNAMKPEPHHSLQIAAHCIILEDYSEQPPTHGILRYTDREFTIDYTPALRKKVIRVLKEMNLCTEAMPPSLQKQKVSKCRACIFQPTCPVGQGK